MGLLTTHSPVQGLGGAFYRYQAPCHANANVPKGGSTTTVALGLGQTRAPGCCARRYCGKHVWKWAWQAYTSTDQFCRATISLPSQHRGRRPSHPTTDLSYCMKQMQPHCRAKNVGSCRTELASRNVPQLEIGGADCTE